MAAARYGELVRERRFVALSSAMLLDNASSWAFNTVFAVVLFERTGSVAVISVAIAARWVPTLFVGPFAGLLGDRYDRVRVLAGSALASAVVMAVLAGLVVAGAPVALMVALSALQALCATPYEPAVQGVVPDLVPERLLAAANGYLEVLRNGGVLLGPLLGAAFLAMGEPALAVALNAVSYLVPLVVALRLGVHTTGTRADDAAAPGVFAELRAGASTLVSQRTAFVLVIACVVDSAIMGVVTVLGVPISVAVGSGPDHYAYLLVATSLGSVLAAGIATRLASRRRLAGVIAVSLVVQSAPLLLIVALPRPWVAAVALLVSGAAMLVVDILAVTALQRDLPREYLSRVFGLFDTVLFGALISVTAVAGVVTEAVGLRTVLIVVGVGTPVVVLALLPALLAADRHTAAVVARLAPIVDLLEHLDLVDGAERAGLERIAAAATRVELGVGEVVLREGDPADDLWLLAEGELAVTATTATDLPHVTAPGYVGEIGLLHERPRSATVTTVAPCIMYRVAGADFLAGVTETAASSSLTRLAGVRLSRTPVAEAA